MPDPLDVPFEPEELTDSTVSPITFPVVGIGASAGGLSALLRFFEHMPADSGMAYVIVLHLSPQYESSAAVILKRVTKMPVTQVLQPTPIEANHVYVIPPSHDLTMDNGHLRLSEPTRTKGMHVAIDLFFRTLAQAHQERAVAIVMSGTGADGAVGLTRVKEWGGITLVQTPDDAEYDAMPRAAIATGMVDFVLRVVDMPQRLLDLWGNASRIRLPKDTDRPLKELPAESVEAARLAEEALLDIMALLRTYSRNDFRFYKRATVLRRIGRRLQVRSLQDLPAYRDYLRNNAEESALLLQDMLISVTNFFRDHDAFEALEQQVLPSLLSGRSPGETVRAWVPGCATGEEAFSVVMLLREQMEQRNCSMEIQLFATDIDERALNFGRNGLYPALIRTDVSPRRLRQFFTKQHDQFRVTKDVREKVLFARHNVLSDPPFSRLDLICCRNLLIYLDRQAQASILEMFRFALKPGGYLFLGNSESADIAPDLFTVVDKKNRIYKANPHARAVHRMPLLLDSSLTWTTPIQPKSIRRNPMPLSLAEQHRKLIDQLVSPSVLIDSEHKVLHLSENVGKFLIHAGGTSSFDLLANVQAELRTELRAALFQAVHSAEPVQSQAIAVQRGDTQAWVRMTVRPFAGGPDGPRLTLVLFDEVSRDGVSAENADGGQRPMVNQLEMQISQLKEYLQEAMEQAETSTEELKASNEELQATNEEFRSASEELETSKEELQSINEELITVNFELKMKVDETTKINDDLQNLMASSDIATIFIDREMRIKRYTLQAASIFNLIESDIDRSLLDITHSLKYELVAQDAAEVFRTLGMIERQVTGSDGKRYLARIRPYRTIDDRIDGAVLTFVDVTALRRAEENLRAGEEFLRIAAATTGDYAIVTMNEEGTIVSWNRGAQRMFGYEEKEIVGQPFSITFTPEDRAVGVPEAELDRVRKRGRAVNDRWHRRKDGSTFFCSGVVTRMEGEAGGFFKIARDMTEDKTREVSRDELLAREQQANELKDQFLAVMSHELKHPLNLIQVNAELLISQPEIRALPAAARAGEAIRLAVASQVKIIDDLLDLSRAQTGKLMLTLVAVELNELASVIVVAAQDAARDKGLTLKYECDADQVVALCDRVRTEQILWNLINNSIKFTPPGGSVTMQLTQEAGFAKFTVTDTGQGIASEFLPKVFDLFVQEAHQSSSQNMGMGVGLTLVRDLAVGQGGQVLAESAGFNQGSCFTVWLPLADSEPLVREVLPPSAALKGLRILAVDDMHDLLEPFALLLRLEGATVDTAASGEKALQLLETASYDLLISDIGMDGMDGYELIQEVRKRPGLSRLKAIALSGYGRQVDVNRALRSGFNGHLAKPATVANICQTIAQLAAKKEG